MTPSRTATAPRRTPRPVPRHIPRAGRRVVRRRRETVLAPRRTVGAAAPGSGLRIAGRQVAVSTILLGDVALLCIIGLVMVGSASSVISIDTYGTPYAILIREAMWMAIGIVALWLAMRVDYRRLRRFSPALLLITFALLFVVLVPGLGVHAMGSSRWVGFGQFRLQPSELMKLALTLFAADFIARRLDEDATDRRIIGPLLLVTGFACVLILAQPDMGTAMVLDASRSHSSLSRVSGSALS